MKNEIVMLSDAVAERNEWDREDRVADFKKYTEEKRIEKLLQDNPHIGVLNGGKYYSYNTGVYVESTNPESLI